MAKHEFEWRVIDSIPASPGWWIEWQFEQDENTMETSYTPVPAWAVVERREYAIASDGGRDVVKSSDRDRRLIAFDPVDGAMMDAFNDWNYDLDAVIQYVYSPDKEPEIRVFPKPKKVAK